MHGNPKPYGGTRPLVMNAGSSPAGRAFSAKSCDVLFRPLRSLEAGAQEVRETIAKRRRMAARSASIATATSSAARRAARPRNITATTPKRWAIGAAVDHLIALNKVNSQSYSAEFFKAFRIRFAAGHGGFPLIGDPDDIAGQLAQVSAAGFSGMCFSFVNYLDEFPYFRDEVLPRLAGMGLRVPLR